jgi:hypothetical protein
MARRGRLQLKLDVDDIEAECGVSGGGGYTIGRMQCTPESNCKILARWDLLYQNCQPVVVGKRDPPLPTAFGSLHDRPCANA